MARATGRASTGSRGSAASDGGMSVREAGRKGGEAVKKKYGPEFYSDIGRKGGEAVRSKHGAEYYSQIGKKGGASNTRGRGRANAGTKRSSSR